MCDFFCTVIKHPQYLFCASVSDQVRRNAGEMAETDPESRGSSKGGSDSAESTC